MDVSQFVKPNAVDCLIFKPKLADDETEQANSYFGGRPKLPEELEWPSGSVVYDVETKSLPNGGFEKHEVIRQTSPHFLAQFDLSELPNSALRAKLPLSGTLFFFIQGASLDLDFGGFAEQAKRPAGFVVFVDQSTRLLPERSEPESTLPLFGVNAGYAFDWLKHISKQNRSYPTIFPKWPIEAQTLTLFPRYDELWRIAEKDHSSVPIESSALIEADKFSQEMQATEYNRLGIEPDRKTVVGKTRYSFSIDDSGIANWLAIEMAVGWVLNQAIETKQAPSPFRLMTRWTKDSFEELTNKRRRGVPKGKQLSIFLDRLFLKLPFALVETVKGAAQASKSKKACEAIADEALRWLARSEKAGRFSKISEEERQEFLSWYEGLSSQKRYMKVWGKTFYCGRTRNSPIGRAALNSSLHALSFNCPSEQLPRDWLSECETYLRENVGFRGHRRDSQMFDCQFFDRTGMSDEQAKAYTLLLRVCSDNLINYNIGDGHMLEFWIPKSDLEKLEFGNVLVNLW